MAKKPKVSIIIVKYKCDQYLERCLSSIGKDISREIIIVDNDRENIGYGAGCNRGARQAKGEYLFFLNPDTIVLPNAIKELVCFLEKNKRVAVVAPLLLNDRQQPYPLQGTEELTPLTAIFALSFMNKYLPNNAIAFRYWLKDWDKKTCREVEVVPGTSFLIKREIFKEIGGFDKNFFLYFEEADLCRRIRQRGWQIFIEPSAKIIHFWEKCTPKTPEIKKIFSQSRFYYFKKHWGILTALVVESLLRGGEWLAQLF